MVQAKVEVTKTKIKNKQKQTNEQTNKIKERNDVKESHLASNLISIDKLVQNVCVCVCVCVCREGGGVEF